MTSIPPSVFLADSVIEYLRSGNVPEEGDADLLNRVPFAELLRVRVKKQDVDAWLMPAIKGSEGEWAGLCLSLLREFDTDPGVRDVLQSRWRSASPFLKAHLMWRILDDLNLSPEWHQRIFDFVLAEKATFHAVALKFLGTPQTIIAQARRRYEDPTFPDTKKWAYLCQVAGVASDPKDAKTFLKSALASSNGFTRHVAQVLLDRFYA